METAGWVQAKAARLLASRRARSAMRCASTESRSRNSDSPCDAGSVVRGDEYVR
ncbi:MAG: hypothetical protein WDO56_24580 [Gammaproteobacteria bacterium]